MMEPVLVQAPGAGGSYDDTALRNRVTGVEDDVGKLKTGKATVASVTAVRDRVDALETRLEGTVTKTVRKDGSGDFSTIGAGLTFFRNALRLPGAKGVLDVGAGVYVEDLVHVPDEILSWVEIRGAGTDLFVANPSDGVSVVGNERNYVVTVNFGDTSAFAVGDQVFFHAGLYSTWRQLTGMGGMRVVEKGPGYIRLRCTSNSYPGFTSQATNRIIRPRTQIRISKTYLIDGGEPPSFSGAVAMCPNVAPTGEGGYDIVRLQRRARMRTACPNVLSGYVIPIPDLYVGHGAGGVTVAFGSHFHGSISSCGNTGRALGVYGGSADCPIFLGCNNGDAVVATDVSQIRLTPQSPDDTVGVYVMGNRYAGIASLYGSEIWFRGLVGSQADAYLDHNSRLTGVLVGLSPNDFYPSPPNRTVGNNNSYVDVA